MLTINGEWWATLRFCSPYPAYDEGIEKGIYQTKRETVLLAFQQGLSLEAILKITQLSEQQVQEILNAV